MSLYAALLLLVLAHPPGPLLGLRMVLTQPPQVRNGIFVPSVVVIVQDLQGGTPGRHSGCSNSDSGGPLAQRSCFRRFGFYLMGSSKYTHLVSHL